MSRSTDSKGLKIESLESCTRNVVSSNAKYRFKVACGSARPLDKSANLGDRRRGWLRAQAVGARRLNLRCQRDREHRVEEWSSDKTETKLGGVPPSVDWLRADSYPPRRFQTGPAEKQSISLRAISVAF